MSKKTKLSVAPEAELRSGEFFERFFNRVFGNFLDIFNVSGNQKRLAMVELGRKNKTPRQIGVRQNYKGLPQYSDKFLNTTFRLFFEDVDRAILGEGLTKDGCANVIVGFRNSARAEDDYRRIVTILLPVYLKLRELGYAHLDLWT